MSVVVEKTPLFTIGQIKFSDLREKFKGVTSGPISAKELRRDTTVSTSLSTAVVGQIDPIVPDCTENESISTENNLSLLTFRNSIKTYDLRQKFTNLNLNIAEQSWNGNLNKNIMKRFIVSGRIGSNDPSKAAATLTDSDVYNLTVEVNGQIWGAGGDPNGGYAGSAI